MEKQKKSHLFLIGLHNKPSKAAVRPQHLLRGPSINKTPFKRKGTEL
jgi:hypothetical protein